MNESTVQTYHLHQRYLIVLTQNVIDVSKSLQTVFGIVMKFGLLFVNSLLGDSNKLNWSLHFYKPYTRNCHSVEIFTIDTFSSENYTNKLNLPFDDMFADRKFKFLNCPVYVSTFSFPPFVIIRNASNGSISYDGIDVTITDEISKTLNLFPIYLQSADKQNRGVIFKNGSATGAMKMVKNNFHFQNDSLN